MSDRPSNAPREPEALHPDDTRSGLLLARLHRAREGGDRIEAARAWRLIAEAELERVRGLVRGYRGSALPDGRVPSAAVDDLTAEVFVRLHDQSRRLTGRSVGELRAFLRAATDFTCRDYERHAAGPDAQSRTASDRAASDRALARLADHLSADDVEGEIARAIIHPALALVDEDKRGVLVMTEAGYGVEEMMERFGISRDAVYQRRHRGLTQLRDGIRELAEDESQ